MKTVTAISILLGLVFLSTQVASIKTRNSFNLPHEEHQSTALRRALDATTFGLQTLKRDAGIMKQIIKLETLGFVRGYSRSCNYTDIEAKFQQLVDATVDFATDASSYLEDIFDKVNVCANANFPKSLSCFLNLVKNCQTDVEAIREALYEFTPVAKTLLNNIVQDVSKCYH